MTLDIRSTSVRAVPIALGYITQSTEIYNEVIYAFIILCLVYLLIVFDVSCTLVLLIYYIRVAYTVQSVSFQLVHRTIAAILGSMAALAVMAVLNLVREYPEKSHNK